MANAERGECDILIDGEVFTLKYTWAALEKLQTLCGGRPIHEVVASMGFIEMRNAIIAGLGHIVKGPRLAAVAKRLELSRSEEYGNAIGMALSLALASDSDGDGDEDEGASSVGKESTGMAS